MTSCDHCLKNIKESELIRTEINGEERNFCCHGCEAVYQLIFAEGLNSFYQTRAWETKGIVFDEADVKFDLSFLEEHIQVNDGQHQIKAYLDGVRCASCVWLNEKMLQKEEGIDEVRINYSTHQVSIKWNPELLNFEDIYRKVKSIGYDLKLYTETEHYKELEKEKTDLLIRLGTAFFLSSQLMIYSLALYAGYFHGMNENLRFAFKVIAAFLTLPVLLYSGLPIYAAAFRGFRRLHFNMDSLIVIGASSAYLYSLYGLLTGDEVYFDTATMIVTLITLGRYIELSAKHKASDTLQKLANLVPATATVLIESEDEPNTFEKVKIPVKSIETGQMVEVLPGERIAVDGIVHEGETEIDESMITGESKPVFKKAGGEVIGGTLNQFGRILICVNKTGDKTVLAGIMKCVEDAQAQKTKIQGLADSVTGIFVPTILILSAMTILYYVWSGSSFHIALMTGISVLVIACPCSLGLATPLAIMNFTGFASSKGILIKNAGVAESANKIKRILFDKTGTITEGNQSLEHFYIYPSALSAQETKNRIFQLESMSEHSIAKAICRGLEGEVEKSRGSVGQFTAVPGKGVRGEFKNETLLIGSFGFIYDELGFLDVNDELEKRLKNHEAEGKTVVYVASGNSLIAVMILSDLLRDETPDVIQTLKQLGYKLGVLSGDNMKTTSVIAESAGIENFHAEIIPEAKKNIVVDYQKKQDFIMMVGDGINDAPALTASMIGVAMGKGTDIAMESADVILLQDDLNMIPFFLKLSLKTRRIIIQNVFWAFFYNIATIPLAISGMLHPIFAAGAMACSSVIVILNSLRVKRIS